MTSLDQQGSGDILSPITRLSRDIAQAARTLSDAEARYLVDAYYMMQEDRKRANNQVRALGETPEPNSVLVWLAAQSETLEAQIKRALDSYTQGHTMGAWMREVKGIGPVLSAGLLAHIDIEKAPTAGHIWRFAGLDPTVTWEKGQKRPWNAALKTLCWKIGQSFMKFSGDDDCYYGQVYRKRKEFEIARNEAGVNEELAKSRTSKVGKSTEAFKHYSAGRLPPAQIDARARRYAVKLFLSHLHGAWYESHFGKPPPLPYPIAHLGHVHFIAPPQRVDVRESAIDSERVIPKERTTEVERVTQQEGALDRERAAPRERANKVERANVVEGTTPLKRANKKEGASTAERAGKKTKRAKSRERTKKSQRAE